MADKKISQLDNATTPLAGTETLPIVQSSATKKVTVANLTVGRTVTMSKLNSDDGALGRWTLEQGASTNNIQSTTTGFGDWKNATLQASGSGVNMTWNTAGNTIVGVGNLVIGTAGKGIDFSANNNVIWRCGAGTPEGAVTAPVGSLYTRTDGGANTTLYVKESGAGNTGWVAK